MAVFVASETIYKLSCKCQINNLWSTIKPNSESLFLLSYKLMLNSGKRIRALSDKKNKYSNSRVVRKKFLNETKNYNPPPPCKLNGRSLRVQTPALIQHFLYIPLRVGFMISGKSMAFTIDLNTRGQYFHHMFESGQYLLIFIYSMKMAQCHTLTSQK
jgi:hypothetical protein